MPKVTIYLPDDLHDEVRARMNGDSNLSRVIQQALDASLGERPVCGSCGEQWPRGYSFCPKCGGSL